MLTLVIYVVLLSGMQVSNTHVCICIIARTLGDVTHSLAPSDINPKTNSITLDLPLDSVDSQPERPRSAGVICLKNTHLEKTDAPTGPSSSRTRQKKTWRCVGFFFFFNHKFPLPPLVCLVFAPLNLTLVQVLARRNTNDNPVESFLRKHLARLN